MGSYAPQKPIYLARIRFMRHKVGVPKIVSASEFAEVLAVMHDAEAGLTIAEIFARLKGRVPRRSLQRRLAELAQRGSLTARGELRGRRYFMPGTSGVAEDAGKFTASLPAPSSATGIVLSEAAQDIRKRVMQPITRRRPVGYRAEFLRDYRPNVTAYLSTADRAKLLELGRASPEPQAAGTYFRKVMDRLLIDLSWNSSRLEGNTYSLLETERLLALGEAATGKDAREAQMILNHKAAIELLAEQAGEIGFNRYTLCNLHALLSENLLPDPQAGGRLRTAPVGVGGSVFHPLEEPHTIEEHFQLLLAKAEKISNAFEQAFFVMVHLPYLQPFDDVNKRTSRLAANIPLVRGNLCPLSFVDVPQADYVNGVLGVYELNRVNYLREVFLWAYERSCARYAAIRQSIGAPDLFRLKHRVAIGVLVAAVVRAKQNKAQAARFVASRAGEIPADERARFIEVVETELQGLHEGNIARHRLRPSEFHVWRAQWR